MKLFSFRRQEQSCAPEWLIACLGNPGSQYEKTRHNVGFAVAEILSERAGVKINKLKFKSLYALGKIDGRNLLILKPQTFMNLSGESVRDASRYYNIPPERIIAVFDDVSLPTGKIRVRAKGSDGGHNGVKSIIYQLNSDSFPRVKVGIGTPQNPEYELKDWVLSRFSNEEKKEMSGSLCRAADAVIEIISAGAESAMNKFNG